jgi:hypothetical protein
MALFSITMSLDNKRLYWTFNSNMLRSILISLFICCLPMLSSAQYYKVGLGLRFGYGIGGTVKGGFTEHDYLEGIATFGALGPGTEVALLYERYIPLRRVDGLSIYLGGGPNVTIRPRNKNYPAKKAAVGISPIAGLDYTLSGAPISFSIDFKPRVQWRSGVFEYVPDFGFSIRYVWGK